MKQQKHTYRKLQQATQNELQTTLNISNLHDVMPAILRVGFSTAVVLPTTDLLSGFQIMALRTCFQERPGLH
jgi:hypothetical protein